tara:strand:+ start:333 stop:704 length:372 start_codon:yes stop_codon:yes gene_type:complete
MHEPRFRIGANDIDEMKTTIYKDERGFDLTHYIIAERCLQVEYAQIMREHKEDGMSDTLINILAGGMTGWHDVEPEKLVSDFKDVENEFWTLYDDKELPWEPYDDDPVAIRDHAKRKENNAQI